MRYQRGFPYQNSGLGGRIQAAGGVATGTIIICLLSIFRVFWSLVELLRNQRPSQIMPDPATVLRSANTIAVVGISSNPSRISHVVATYLKHAGYTVIPINPGHAALLDVPCYPDLNSVPSDIQIDIVDVFRRPEFTVDVVAQVAQRAVATGYKPVVWTQIGVSSPEAEQAALEADLPYIANTCTMAVHKRAF